MPIAIIVTETAIPAIIEETTADKLVAACTALAVVPSGLDAPALKLWLQTRPKPSGWYEGRAEALEAARCAADTAQATRPTPEGLRDARKALGLSRVEFGRALGFGGNPNTINKSIYELETNPAKTLRPEKHKILSGLLAQNTLKPTP